MAGSPPTWCARAGRTRRPPPLVFALDVAGTRYTGEGKGWLLVEFEPGRYRAVGQAPTPGRAEYLATEILVWDEGKAVEGLR